MDRVIDDLWATRAVGLKLWGFDHNPLYLKDRFNLLAQANSKGDPHGSRLFFPENQIYYAMITQVDDNWGDSLRGLITAMGGTETIEALIKEVKPKNYWFVINTPKADLHSNNSKAISSDVISLVASLSCDVGFNIF